MRLIKFVIAVGFISSLFGCHKPSESSSGRAEDSATESFVSASDYEQNRINQMSMAPRTMEQLRGHGVTVTTELKLEYFFYTDSKVKAEVLASKLDELGYNGGHDVAAGDSSQFVITGWTTPMLMSDRVVVDWAAEMCDLGYEFDCEFDGWGTNPSQ